MPRNNATAGRLIANERIRRVVDHCYTISNSCVCRCPSRCWPLASPTQSRSHHSIVMDGARCKLGQSDLEAQASCSISSKTHPRKPGNKSCSFAIWCLGSDLGFKGDWRPSFARRRRTHVNGDGGEPGRRSLSNGSGIAKSRNKALSLSDLCGRTRRHGCWQENIFWRETWQIRAQRRPSL